MKRFLIIISTSACLSAYAQPGEVNESFHHSHVKCVREYRVIDGQKRLVRKMCYDTTGQNTSWLVINGDAKHPIVNCDTFIIYATDSYNEIAIDHDLLYDSIQCRTTHSNGTDTLTKDTWAKGRIILHDVYISDTLPRLTVYQDPQDRNHLVTYHYWTYEYDSLHRLTAQHEKTVEDDGVKRTVRIEYGFAVSYTDSGAVYHHYTRQYDGRNSHYISYRDASGRHDSAVFFKDDGSIDYTFTVYKNISGEDSLSVERDNTGRITNRNSTTYNGSLERTEHYDANGLWKTAEDLHNNEGLISSRVETQLQTGKSEVTLFEYEYF